MLAGGEVGHDAVGAQLLVEGDLGLHRDGVVFDDVDQGGVEIEDRLAGPFNVLGGSVLEVLGEAFKARVQAHDRAGLLMADGVDEAVGEVLHVGGIL